MREAGLASSPKFSFRDLLVGAAAGFVATVPMSIVMLVGWQLLPPREKYPLPPRLITDEITEHMGIEEHLTENELTGLTVSSHFVYGALFGSIYRLLEKEIPMHSSLKGTFTGLAVWVGSYLGWLPALGILRSATHHPWRRNLLMILAHIVWGVTLGEVTRKLSESD